jgi:hypothetical protein
MDRSTVLSLHPQLGFRLDQYNLPSLQELAVSVATTKITVLHFRYKL